MVLLVVKIQDSDDLKRNKDELTHWSMLKSAAEQCFQEIHPEID